jgi:hypothetical protein
MHINIFCHIHFYQSINKAAGVTGYSLVSVHSRMKELVRVTSREDYFLLCEALIGLNLFQIYSEFITNIF